MPEIILEKVTIPTWANPFPVTVNGKTYYYPAGETLKVPYEVAEVIRQLEHDPSLPPSSGGGGTGGGADILNDKGIIKQLYLPDGYPYAEVKEEYILPETEWESTGGEALLPNEISFIVGETYIVNWNGTNFECVAADVSDMGIPNGALGNYGALNGETGTGEPFVIAAIGVDGVVIIPMDSSSYGTVSVYGKTRTVTTINGKYLPVYSANTEDRGVVNAEDIHGVFFPDNAGLYVKIGSTTYGDVQPLPWHAFSYITLPGKDNSVRAFLENVYGYYGPAGNEQVVVFQTPFYYEEYKGLARFELVFDGDSEDALLKDIIYHYNDSTGGGTTVILPPTEAVYSAAQERFFISSGVDASKFTLGEKYTINYNGADYECVAVDGSIMGVAGLVGLGNISVFVGGEDTGEPFVLGIAPLELQPEMGVAGIVIALDGAASVTVSISSNAADDDGAENVTVFVDIYGTIAGTYQGFTSDKTENIQKRSHTNAEILALVKRGKNVIIRNFYSDSDAACKYYTLSAVDYTYATFTNVEVNSNWLLGGQIRVRLNGEMSMYEKARTW